MRHDRRDEFSVIFPASLREERCAFVEMLPISRNPLLWAVISLRENPIRGTLTVGKVQGRIDSALRLEVRTFALRFCRNVERKNDSTFENSKIDAAGPN